MADYITLYKYNVAKLSEAIVVTDGKTNDTDTSLTFIGKGAPSFGIAVNQDFLYLLENFANVTPPLHPTEGQLWYDSSNDTLTGKKLKVFDSTVWKPINGIWQQDNPPETPERGDIWVNTANAQLYIRTLSGWTLVGPTYSNVLKTGSYADEIKDNMGGVHRVIKNYIDDNVVEVIASADFFPQPPIDGFADGLHPGVNLSSTYNGKLNATATVADSLSLSDGSTITGDNLVKTTGDSTINARLYIKELAVGQASSNGSTTPWVMNMSDNGYQANLQNPVPGGKFVFQATTLETDGSLPVNLLSIDGSTSGVGINLKATDNPKAELDVNGSVVVANSLTITSSAVAIDVTKGVSKFKNIVSTGVSTFSTSTFVDTVYLGTTDWPISTPAIVPVGTGNSSPNIGTNDNPFGAVYSKVFVGPQTISGSANGVDSSGRLIISNSSGLSTGDPLILSHSTLAYTASKTSPTSNYIDLNSKTGLVVGMPIVFEFSSTDIEVTQTFSAADAQRPNHIAVSSIAGLAIGMSIVFDADISTITAGTVYFVQAIHDTTHISIGLTPSSSALTLGAATATVNATVGSVFGGLVSGTTYYVRTISATSVQITVSDTYNGSIKNLGVSVNIPGASGVTVSAGGPYAANLASNVLYYIHRVYDATHISVAASQADVQTNTPIVLPSNVTLSAISYRAGVRELGNTFVGNLTGGASKLTNSSTWSISGQVSAAGFVYSGGAGQNTFVASLTESAISDQVTSTTVADNDTLLISQTASGTLKKVTKNDLLKDLAAYKVPSGAVTIYAGPVDNVPEGWLLCDGSLVDGGYFPTLFSAIKYTYGKGSVPSQFRLPDLRSRVPMGYDNMTNSETGNGQATLVPAAPSNAGSGRTNITHPSYDQSYALGNTAPVVGQITAGATGFDYSSASNAPSNTALHFHALNYIIKT
jgi:microcystin-dependent protein